VYGVRLGLGRGYDGGFRHSVVILEGSCATFTRFESSSSGVIHIFSST
jgi:hypothetical protein